MMRITAFHAENIKRIKVVDVTPPPAGVIEIAGNNGSGKTSVLDSLWWLLGGDSLTQERPIRAGEQSARITATLQQGSTTFLVTRTYSLREDGTSYTTNLTIKRDGVTQPRPQTDILDQLIGPLALDPLAFARQAPKDRLAALKALVPGVQWDELETRRQTAYDNRRDLGRDLRRAEAALTPLPPDTPTQPIDIAPLRALLADASQQMTRRGEALSALSAAQRRSEAARRDLVEANEALQRAHERVAQCRIALESALDEEAATPEPPPPVDVSAMVAEIDAAEARNALYSRRQKREAEEQRIAALRSQIDACTETIADIDDGIRRALADADLPVRGMALGPTDVTLNGVPFDQASDAEQLRASMAVAMATSPRLRVIRIRDGSLLDSAAMDVIRDVAAADDWQIWIERVVPDGDDAIILEDGEVKR